MSQATGFDALIDFAAGKVEAPRRGQRAFVPFLGTEGEAPAFDDLPSTMAHPEPEPDLGEAALPTVASDEAPDEPAVTSAPEDKPAEPPHPVQPAPPAGPDPAALRSRIAELEADITALNKAHTAEMVDKVGAAIAELGARVSTELSNRLAPVLEHALLDQSRAEAVRRFADELGGLIAVGGIAKVCVTGPAPLLDALRAAWRGPAPLPELVAGDGLELVASLDDAVLATRIATLRERLTGAAA